MLEGDLTIRTIACGIGGSTGAIGVGRLWMATQ
jgi:hypothetical protein